MKQLIAIGLIPIIILVAGCSDSRMEFSNPETDIDDSEPVKSELYLEHISSNVHIANEKLGEGHTYEFDVINPTETAKRCRLNISITVDDTIHFETEHIIRSIGPGEVIPFSEELVMPDGMSVINAIPRCEDI